MVGLDSESCDVLLNFIEKMTIDLNLRTLNFTLSYPEYTEETLLQYQDFQKNDKPEFIRKGLSEPLEVASVYFHHGMRALPDFVKNYVRNKIFIDGGACDGDSTLVFLKYCPRKVLAFEISPGIAEKFRQNMRKNNIPESLVCLILKGLGEKKNKKLFFDSADGETTLSEEGNAETEIIPLDSCKEIDSPVGWIKIDLEGYGLPAVKGMVETIKRDRPVLTLAVYHCADELFGIKKLLESWDLNYKIMFRSLRFDGYHELTLIAYPAELE